MTIKHIPYNPHYFSPDGQFGNSLIALIPAGYVLDKVVAITEYEWVLVCHQASPKGSGHNSAQGQVFTLAEIQLIVQGLHVIGEQNRVDKSLIKVWNRLCENFQKSLEQEALAIRSM